jgi:glutamate-1-semialdehyde 2,1-aminomutase
MKTRDYAPVLAALAESYARYAPQSGALHARALQHQVDGGSHTLRLTQPFPPRIAAAQGAWLKDEDGHDILDFWQGHLANVLGHNPEVVTTQLARALERGLGLQTGFVDRLQIEAAEILCQQTGAERVRFTTSGSLANMYAIMLARAFTGRNVVLKVGGGWHGAQPWGLKGVGFHSGGFQRVETEGLPRRVTDKTVVTSFNDPHALREYFRQYGDQTACFIVEPFLGAGGFMAATPAYLHTARELTRQYGAILILDEVISGFRFRAGNASALYGVQPDLATFGKVIGGGMPVAAVAGRADILELVARAGGQRVRFSGGTFSAHPASMLAAKTMMTYLAQHEGEVYPRLARLGERARQAITEAFAEQGLPVFCTGHGNEAIPGSSMFMFHFPHDPQAQLRRPEEWSNPSVCDVVLGYQVMDLALLLEDVFVQHCHGGFSAAHTEEHVDLLGEACRRAARRVKVHLA